tara:strand:+ start:271 stop:522 length:252 start_codon:yes stop_codon:yes gene_type:complete
MAIKKEEDKKKNGMKIIDNMDGEKNANKKLMAGVINPFTELEQMELKKLGYSRALKDPSIMSSKGKEMGIKILKDILKVNKQR